MINLTGRCKNCDGTQEDHDVRGRCKSWVVSAKYEPIQLGDLDPDPARPLSGEVFRLGDGWRVSFGGRVLLATWTERGPAETCLSLLQRGGGTVTGEGGVKWNGKELR